MELLTVDISGVQNDAVLAKAKQRSRPQEFPEVGSVVRAARKAAGLSQEQVQERSKLGSQAISDAERGLNSTIETLTKIAKAIGYSNFIALVQNPEFRSEIDPQTQRLLKFWELLKHPAARKDALESIAMIAAHAEEPNATADEE